MGDRVGEVLVIEDDRAVLRAVRRFLAPTFRVRTASTKREGLFALRDRTRTLSLILVDAKLGDERDAGLELLDVAAEEHKGVRRALITGSMDPGIRNGAAERRSFLLSKPFGREQLLPLLDDANGLSSQQADPMLSALDLRAREWNLTPRQREIVRLALAGMDKDDIARELGVSINTLRSRVAEILARSAHAGLDQVLIALLRDVIAGVGSRRD